MEIGVYAHDNESARFGKLPKILRSGLYIRPTSTREQNLDMVREPLNQFSDNFSSKTNFTERHACKVWQRIHSGGQFNTSGQPAASITQTIPR